MPSRFAAVGARAIPAAVARFAAVGARATHRAVPRRFAAARARGLALAGALAVSLGVPAAAAGALVDGGGAPIPQTDPTIAGHVVGTSGCSARSAGPTCRPLAEPASPADDAPAALAALGPRGAPEDDLAAALDTLSTAPDAGAAASAVAEAQGILAGAPLPGRAYSGIPLLNWNTPAKVRRVPAGGNVVVTLVRTPQHTLSDTWLLDFEDPAQAYTITYRISELGGTLGGELRPTPLLAEAGRPLGGLHSALVSLAPPALDTGTALANRFTATRGLPGTGGAEFARLAVQEVTVRMPPPGLTEAVIEPGGGPGLPAPVTFATASAERRAAAAAGLGFSSADPTPAERDRAIARLAPGAPERQLWDDLQALPPAGDAGFLAAARSLGTQDAPLVDAMRTRTVLPAGVAADPAADVTVVLQNGESYVSRASVRATPGQPLRVQVVNRDGFDRTAEVLALHGRHRVLGSDDWGTFDWSRFPAVSLAAHRPPAETGGTRLLTVDAPADTFALWIGDPAGGDQAAAVVDVETGPRRETLRLGAIDGSLPVHAAFAPDGDLWVGLGGTDEVVRLAPGAKLGDSRMSTHLIPGGAHQPTSPTPPMGPVDVKADHRGLVWVTLAAGNAIARIDPAQTADGTERGIRTYPLPACGEGACAPVFAAAPGELPTRQPLQMAVTYDAEGTALVWFTESAADRIGLLRVAPDGRELGQSHFSCGCTAPLGLALDADGDVWFTEGVDNRIGRLTPDLTDVAAAGAATLRHYRIPSGVPVMDPELSPTEVVTSSPHSVTVDARGLVFFTESATGKLGRLDPAHVAPGTTQGIAELDLPRTPFGADPVPADLAVDRAGTVFWADEYGDAVGAIDTAGPPEGWRAREPWRPAARRSLTDSPLLDSGGDLFFVEAGANLLTRISGAGAGQPLPAAPPRVELDLAADSMAVSGLREADTFDATVERGGGAVASVTGVVLAGGSATVAGSAWGTADSLRPGDVLRIAPHGRFARAAIRVRAAELDARRTATDVEGRALHDGRPVPGPVEVVGAAGLRAAVDMVSGTYAVPAGALAGATPRAVAVEVARPGVVVRTVAPIDAAGGAGAGDPSSPTGSAPASDAQPGGAGTSPAQAGRPGGASDGTRPDPATPSAARPGGPLASGPDGRGAPAVPTSTPKGPRGQPSCAVAARRTATARPRNGSPLRRAVAELRTCLARRGLWVGASAGAMHRALPQARPSGRAWRVTLPLAPGRAAEVRVELNARRTRVARIVVRAIAARAGRTNR